MLYSIYHKDPISFFSEGDKYFLQYIITLIIFCPECDNPKLQIRTKKEGKFLFYVQGGSNMTGTDLYVNKPHCAAAVRP